MVFPYFTFSIGVTTASAAIIGLAMANKVKAMKADWENQKCQPHGMVAAAIPGLRPSGVNATQNYKDCQTGMFQGYFSTFIAPITSIIYVITDIITEISNSINNIRLVITHLRTGLENMFKSISSKIYNISVKIAWLFKRIIKIVGEIFNVFADLFGILKYAFFTMSTIWNGTIGALLRWLNQTFCFDENTLIELNNNKKIKIKDIKVGDKLLNNNEVLAIFKLDSSNIEMYKYNNIILAGSHLVKENNKWIRVEESNTSIKIDYNKKYLYCLSTETATINIDNNIYADYLETTNYHIIKNMFNLILNHLNNDKNNIDNIRTKETLYHWGVSGNTIINLKNSKKKIKNCKIGDILESNSLFNNRKIKGIVKFKISNYKSQPLYNYKGILCTGSMIVYENEKWIPVFNSLEAYRVKNKPKYMYNIFTSDNIYKSNNVTFTDFEQTNNSKINNIIDKIVSESK